MDAEVIIIPLAVFAALVAAIGLITGVIGQWITNRTVREALRTSPDNVGMVADKIARRPGWNMDAWGLVIMAIGAALATAALIGPTDQRIPMLQAALLPGFIGAALFGQRWLSRPGGAGLPAE